MSPPAPAFRLIVAGSDLSSKDITPKVRSRLVSLTLTEKRGGEADQLDLVLSDHDGAMQIPPKGATIELAIGWKGQTLTSKGSFKVDETSHSGMPDQLTIRARSADFTAELRTRREKSWTDTTLGAVLQEIVGRHGLAAKISGDLAGKALPILAQSRESDSAFLKRLGKRFDAVATIKAGALLFAPIGSGASAAGAPLPDFTIRRRDGDRHDWRTGDREGAYTGVSASWRSTAGATRHTVRAGAQGKVKHLKTVYAAQADAQQAANAEWARVQRGVATFSLELALGQADLYPERKGKVSGFKPEIDATSWLISQVVHSLVGDTGFGTRIELETAP